jgi:hypothetical protein
MHNLTTSVFPVPGGWGYTISDDAGLFNETQDITPGAPGEARMTRQQATDLLATRVAQIQAPQQEWPAQVMEW